MRVAVDTRDRFARWRSQPEPMVLPDVRRRLELMLYALHGRDIRIAATPAATPTFVERVGGLFTPRHLRARPVAWSDGDTVLLPPRLAHRHGDPVGVAQYRLLALVQAERIARGTATPLAELTDPLERDLYLLRESMAVEARLERDVASVVAPLAAARQAALQSRPSSRALSGTEHAVESIVRDALTSAAATSNASLADSTPTDSLAWARSTRASLRGPYRGVAGVAHWGGAPVLAVRDDAQPGNPNAPRDGVVEFEAKTVESGGDGAETDQADPTRDGDAIDDDRGTPSSSDEPATARSAPSAGEAPSTPATDGDASDDPSEAQTETGVPDDPGPGVPYPEWDHLTSRYRRDGVIVRERLAESVDGTWADDTLRQHAPMVRRIRERFEPLRAQRLRLNQQRDGEELDLQSCVQAMVDVRTGHTPSDRLYASVRPARRAMTICLLVDASGSTDAPLPNGQRIVDLEREAMLLASEAFDVLGDDYALLTFSSRGARNVRVATLKDFRERNGAAVRDRIAAIEPGNNTRLGAAIRHATARLSQQPLGRRLLLILSDGRPNDYDEYYADAAVEDSRQAIHEARAQGVFPFCLTIDRDDGPEYLPRIFGTAGYTVLREPAQLPLALVRVVRQLLTR